jgi:hypothetical protein
MPSIAPFVRRREGVRLIIDVLTRAVYKRLAA